MNQNHDTSANNMGPLPQCSFRFDEIQPAALQLQMEVFLRRSSTDLRIQVIEAPTCLCIYSILLLMNYVCKVQHSWTDLKTADAMGLCNAGWSFLISELFFSGEEELNGSIDIILAKC